MSAEPPSPKVRVVHALRGLLSTGFFNIVGSSVFNRIITFLSGMVLVRVLSKEDYGAYSYALTLVNYFILFNGLGTSSCVVQLCVEQKEDGRAEYVYQVANSIGILWDMVLTCAIAFVAMFVELSVEGANLALLCLAPLPLCSLLVEFQQQRLRSEFKTREYAWATNINSVVLVALSVLGAFVGSTTGLSLARSLAMVLSVIVVFFLFRTRIYLCPPKAPYVLIADIVKMSLTVCVTNAVSQALMLIGTSFVGFQLRSADLTATYSTATAIPFALAFLPSMITVYAMPFFVQHASERRWVLRSLALCTLATMAASSLVAVFCIGLADWLIPFVFGDQYKDAIPSFRILIVAFAVAAPFRTVSGNVLASHRRYVFNLLSGLVSLVTCSVVTWWALPSMGIEGAAIGYLAAMVVGSIVNVGGVLAFAGCPRHLTLSREDASDERVQRDS